jgi:hypothetical protein
MPPIQVSSSWTLILKIFLPVLYIAFFGTFVMVVWFTQKIPASVSGNSFRITLTLILLVGLFLFYKTVFRLHRLDMDDTYLYVTNYWTHRRYLRSDIEQIQSEKIPFFRLGRLKLKGEGFFGNEILFLSKKILLDRLS